EVRAVFVSNAGQLAKIASIRGRLPELRHVIVFDADTPENNTLSLESLISDGRKLAATADFRAMVMATQPSDWASIIYTSGTTGDPKGAILSHGNFMSNVRQS